MLVKYTIHKFGTPKMAFPNHPSYWESEYWNDYDGWGHKSTATVFEDKYWDLPLDGEWVEIYINEPVGEYSA
jgi:hypothetical protein